MLRILKQNKFFLLWTAIPLIVAAEIFQQWNIPRSMPSEEDWISAAEYLKTNKKAGDLIIVVPEWAVQGKVYFFPMITWKDFGRFDTSSYKRIFEVSMKGARSSETTGIKPEQIQHFGKLTVSRFVLPKPDKIIYSFIDNIKKAKTYGNVEKNPKIIIDQEFIPRRVISSHLNKPATITFNKVPLNGSLRIYGIIEYHKSFTKDSKPVILSIYINDKFVGTHEINHFGPLEPIEYNVSETDKGEVRFEMSAENNLIFGLHADVRIKEDR